LRHSGPAEKIKHAALTKKREGISRYWQEAAMTIQPGPQGVQLAAYQPPSSEGVPDARTKPLAVGKAPSQLG
jgi:hypothetical protein